MTTYKMTLTPNRSTPQTFARLATYERKGNRLTRVLKRYTRGAVTGAKTIPFDRNRDWTGVSTGHYTAVPMKDAPNGNPFYTKEEWLDGVPVPEEPKVTRETKRRRVYFTAKRDWLVEMGAIGCRLNSWDQELTWNPGDIVVAVPMDPNNEFNRMVDCYDDIDEDTEDFAIYGGNFYVS